MYSIEFDMLSGNQDILITKVASIPERSKWLCEYRETFEDAMQYVTTWIQKENAQRIKDNRPSKYRRYLIHYQG